MLIWCIYDISNNKVRNKIVKLSKEYGLYRVQKSVFLGEINNNNLDEFQLKCAELIDEETDSVYIFPLCKKDFQNVITLGQAFDENLVTDKVKELFI